MNFYAHVVAASWHNEEPAFALGSMLPDFASMLRARLPRQESAVLARGVKFHHRSDRVFHALDEFRAQESWTLQHMLSAGLRRGPARGVAHVGVELCLDGALVGNPSADRLYTQALEYALHSPPTFEDAETSTRFQGLATRLVEHGLPTDYRDPQVVGERLLRILKPRPLLRLASNEEALLMAAVEPLHRRVGAKADTIMQSLARLLSEHEVATSDGF